LDSIRTTGEHRELLISCLLKAVKGELSALQTKGIIGCSNQINQSISSEIRMRQAVLKSGQKPIALGMLELGEHGRFIESETVPVPASPANPESANVSPAKPEPAKPEPAKPFAADKKKSAKATPVATKITAAKKAKNHKAPNIF